MGAVYRRVNRAAMTSAMIATSTSALASGQLQANRLELTWQSGGRR
jgi:hypothetical protein